MFEYFDSCFGSIGIKGIAKAGCHEKHLSRAGVGTGGVLRGVHGLDFRLKKRSRKYGSAEVLIFSLFFRGTYGECLDVPSEGCVFFEISS